MKKTLAFVLALMLCLLCVPSMAEETQVYTHPTQGYSVVVPSQWLCVDKDNMDSIIIAYENGEVDFTGTNAATLQSLKAQVADTDCAVLIDPYANNLVIVNEELGMEITNGQFIAMMIPMFRTQLLKQIPSLQFADEVEKLTLGEWEFVVLSGEYDMGGLKVCVDMLFLINGTTLYTLNLTATTLFGQEAADTFYTEVLDACASFKMGAAE